MQIGMCLSCTTNVLSPPFQIMIPFLLESKYKNLLPLFVGRNVLLVSPETRAQEMLRVLKNVPQINLLGRN